MIKGNCLESVRKEVCVRVCEHELSKVNFYIGNTRRGDESIKGSYTYFCRAEKQLLSVNLKKGVIRREAREQRTVRYGARWSAGKS